MTCPQCGGKNFTVKDTHFVNNQINRTRLCEDCLYKFSTVEMYRDDLKRLRQIESVAYKLQEVL